VARRPARSPELNLLSQVTLTSRKRVRTDTTSAATRLGRFAAFRWRRRSSRTSLTCCVAARRRRNHRARGATSQAGGIGRLTIATVRSQRRGAREARVGAQAIQLTDMLAVLHEHDIVYRVGPAARCQCSQRRLCEARCAARASTAMFMVDIACPRHRPRSGRSARRVSLFIDDLSRSSREHRRAPPRGRVRRGAHRRRHRSLLREKRIRDGQHLVRAFPRRRRQCDSPSSNARASGCERRIRAGRPRSSWRTGCCRN